MSLVQLLSVGKSLLNIQDKPSPYRMRQENLLPKFGRASRPEVEKKAVAEKQPRETRKEPNVKDSQQVREKRRVPLLRWVKAVNPFARKNAETITKTTPVEKAPVQVELLLDSVRPIRNDLHETDLVVVPARAAEKKVAAAQRETEPARAGGTAGAPMLGKQ
jgi:hypothetical protein